jgi:predicted AAA+ superfamily ATPase
VLVTGARQTGKTTLLKENADGSGIISFDDYIQYSAVKQDAIGFVKSLTPPVILDEVQYAPEVFRPLKLCIDNEQINGAYLMTGSQKFELMKGVSESLAGRIGILTLLGLSEREINGIDFTTPFLPASEYINSRRSTAVPISTSDLWVRIQRGSFPKLYADMKIEPYEFYSAYVTTYIERDVRALSQVGDELTFMQFLTACAARTASILNLSDICKDVGISSPTAKRWLSILQASGIVYLLQPFSLNVSARVIKTPKLYFLDTGLTAYLCKWLTPATLENGAMSGAFFETYVVGEIIKSYRNAGMEPPIYYYRDVDKREVDVLFYLDGSLHPLEIKKTASPNVYDAKHFEVLNRIETVNIQQGGIVCMYDNPLRLGDRQIIPVNML